jgi:hypothetical protein
MTPRWYNQTINMFISIGNGSPRNTLRPSVKLTPAKCINKVGGTLARGADDIYSPNDFAPRETPGKEIENSILKDGS